MKHQFVKLYSAATLGVDGYIIEVEIDIQNGLPKFEISGLADSTIKEAKERVRSAIINSGYEFPLGRIIVNLAPADQRKEGSHFDLVIAFGILLSSNQIKLSKNDLLSKTIIAGELALDGNIRAVSGILPMSEAAAMNSFSKIIVPHNNQYEAKLMKKIDVIAVDSINTFVEYFNGEEQAIFISSNIKPIDDFKYDIDFLDVVGQEHAKKGIVIACSGDHHLLMVGPPGAGKSMLAKRIPTILPELCDEEAFEVRKIQSIAGKYIDDQQINTHRPFRDPHHTITVTGLTGGESPPKPGEITLAHHGILFLDELTEFSRRTLEVLRQPLEEEQIVIVRGKYSVKFPSKFMLIAALNPCPCGYFGSATKACICKEYERKRYLNKISGPLRDRFDLQLELREVDINEIQNIKIKKNKNTLNSSEKLKKLVIKTREKQITRQGKLNGKLNSKELERYVLMDEHAKSFIKQTYIDLGLSMRGYHKVLKIARTIADMEDSINVTSNHIAEALSYRSLEKYYQ